MNTITVTLKSRGYEGVKGQLVSVVETPTGVVYRVRVSRKGIDLAPRIIGFAPDAVRLPRKTATPEPVVPTLTYQGRSGDTMRFTDSSTVVKLAWDGKTRLRLGHAYRVSSDKFGVITSVKAA